MTHAHLDVRHHRNPQQLFNSIMTEQLTIQSLQITSRGVTLARSSIGDGTGCSFGLCSCCCCFMTFNNTSNCFADTPTHQANISLSHLCHTNSPVHLCEVHTHTYTRTGTTNRRLPNALDGIAASSVQGALCKAASNFCVSCRSFLTASSCSACVATICACCRFSSCTYVQTLLVSIDQHKPAKA